mmetsp:Transcript_63726/g.205356  ORF Transcript_63726/g.205356 Transcript_63726/m.205356 type:complete len:205 (-) Transcript_63726:258-872(-)
MLATPALLLVAPCLFIVRGSSLVYRTVVGFRGGCGQRARCWASKFIVLAAPLPLHVGPLTKDSLAIVGLSCSRPQSRGYSGWWWWATVVPVRTAPLPLVLGPFVHASLAIVKCRRRCGGWQRSRRHRRRLAALALELATPELLLLGPASLPRGKPCPAVVGLGGPRWQLATELLVTATPGRLLLRPSLLSLREVSLAIVGRVRR